MSEETEYRVTQAVLRTDSTWLVVFASKDDPSDAAQEVRVAIPPGVLDNMFFDISYSRAQIDAVVAGEVERFPDKP